MHIYVLAIDSMLDHIATCNCLIPSIGESSDIYPRSNKVTNQYQPEHWHRAQTSDGRPPCHTLHELEQQAFHMDPYKVKLHVSKLGSSLYCLVALSDWG